MDRHELLEDYLAAEMIGMKTDDPMCLIGKNERIGEISQGFRGLAYGKAVAVSFQQAHHTRRVSVQMVEIVQDDAYTAVAPSGEEAGDRIRPRATVEFEALEIGIEDANLLPGGRNNDINRLQIGGACVECFKKTVRHGDFRSNESAPS